ncbi:sigma-70 family RNA polymerase sigma factor [Fimbriiglobus ruber]|uniref:High-affnity carbon uptake protein Hat/HatR n=1 Tax=Fimbriiglobus ruber TaxID=1908690 RepID=A0A225DJ89_9BACT|nr:sigma-70 family RNA polymerase sigma factor [Fimbriiglobus ruber]OWK36455.1 High-affnity carbon uptake protein Hat/HatR [Fimbriiglobus ruber]
MSVEQPDTTGSTATYDDLSDRELLRRFDFGHDEAAFAAVLKRHGPMVLRVCQRVLDRREDAEDAFQATFLVLARKVGSVSWRESIGTWLHEAAHRLSREFRRNLLRRQNRDRKVPARTGGDALAEVTGRELLAILDEEMTNLPDEYRAPLLLCHLEEMGQEEAARHLGCSVSTLKRRLQQARELLQARLTRRGLILSVAALAALLATGTATASVPVALATNTTRAATMSASGVPPAAGLVSPGAASLARDSLPVVVSAKLKLVIGLLAVGGLAVAGVSYRGLPVGGGWPVRVAAETPGPSDPTVSATVETNLGTAGENIRQFGFDGNPATAFVSARNPRPGDYYTLVFDHPVDVKSVGVQTGDPDGGRALTAGNLEGSSDGTRFDLLAGFKDGTAKADAGGRKLTAVRVRMTVGQAHPLVIREIAIDSDPVVAVYRHPVEFVVDAREARDMADWAERAARICEREYAMICEELSSDGFKPPTRVTLVLRWDAASLVAATDDQVIASAGYFHANPHEIGALIHATSYVVQAYRGGGSPTWLVHGIADYIRFFKFEPGALAAPDPETARYDGNSRETAAFLAYLVARHDKQIVRHLNAALREGRYTDDVWVTYTGKSLRELGEEWHHSLHR